MFHIHIVVYMFHIHIVVFHNIIIFYFLLI